jgi:hypothetical protein
VYRHGIELHKNDGDCNDLKTNLKTNTGLALFTIFAISCSEPVEQSQSDRQVLGYEEMMSTGLVVVEPVKNDHFMPAPDATGSLHDFSGSLVFPAKPMSTVPERIDPAIINGKLTQDFPALTVEFFTHDGHLVPVVRDLINHSDPDNFWQLQADPGRVWSEAGDRGYSRASFPFIISGDVEGDAWNGIATFLFDDDSVSSLRYQVVQHSKPYFIRNSFTAAGHIEVEYIPEPGEDHSALELAFEQELSDRMPMKSWSDLALEVGAEQLDGFDASVPPDGVITSGLVIDGVIYAQPFSTASGAFPYPYGMRHGVWSMSKSMLGMLSMLRLAQKYGDEIFDYRIADYLDVTAMHQGWDDVTFGDALNMATGIGSGSDQTDPNNISDGYISGDQQEYDAWYLAHSSREKLDYVFANPNHDWGPGEHARYRDRDIFALSAAMDSLVKRREGPDADVWDIMMEEVYRPLGIHRMSTKFTTESGGERGVLFLGWALYMTVDDIAKVATLLQNGGNHEGRQLLHPGKVKEALYQTEKRGLPTGLSNEYGLNSYHMTLWHSPFTTASGNTVSIPNMQGWGGMTVSLMPNGITAFRLKHDGNEGSGMVEVANRMRPFDDSD